MPSFRLPSKTSLFVIFVIIAVSLFTLYPSFKLALFGDDWLAFVRYLYHLGPTPESPGRWNYLNYFLTPYGAQDILMGLLQNIYGYNSTLYYITSYFFRLIAAFSLYPLVYYLTKSKLSASFGVLFFSVTTIGFDTTNWVFNMPSYISIGFFSFFLLYYVRSKNEKNHLLFLPAALFYYLSYVIAPIRMHGVLPLILLIELFWILQKQNWTEIKSSFLRLLTLVLVFLFISNTGQSNGTPSDWSQRFFGGITMMQNMLSEGRFDFLFYPLAIFGGSFLPYITLNPSWRILDFPNYMAATLPVFFVFTIIMVYFAKNIEYFKKTVKFVLPGYILWWILVYFIHRQNLISFNNSIFIISLTVGGYIFINTLSLIIIYFKRPISDALFIGLAWSFVSFLAAWWYSANEIFLSTHRYLIVTAAGISILLATIIGLGGNKKYQISLFATFCLILILHIIATRIYINNLLASHGQEVSNKIWSSFPDIPEIGTGNQPRIFYFPYTAENFNIVHDVITFGFPTRIGLMYKYYMHYSPSNNAAISDPRELVSAVTDGESLKAHGWQKGPIDVNQIYAFQLQGRDKLVDITSIVREELNQIVKNYKSSNP